MKIYRENLYDDNAIMKVQKSLFLNPSGLDFWLQKMRRDGLPYTGEFRKKLLSFYTVPLMMAAETVKLQINISELEILSSDLELAKASLLKNFDLMGFKTLPEEESLEINTKLYLRTYLHKSYFLAKSFEAILPKKDAIHYYKKITDERTRSDGTGNHPKTVSDYLFINDKHSGPFIGAFNYVECELGECKLAKKITKCKWCEILKEINDSDYAYAVACHYDFEATKVENPDFTLTRNGTLIQGRPYCDFLWHDKRVNTDLTHPPKEFWDNL